MNNDIEKLTEAAQAIDLALDNIRRLPGKLENLLAGEMVSDLIRLVADASNRLNRITKLMEVNNV